MTNPAPKAENPSNNPLTLNLFHALGERLQPANRQTRVMSKDNNRDPTQHLVMIDKRDKREPHKRYRNVTPKSKTKQRNKTTNPQNKRRQNLR